VDTTLARALDLLDRTVDGLDPEALARRPPGKWSAAEIVEHLARSYHATSAALRRALESGSPRGRPRAFGQHAACFVVLTLGHLPSGRQAPEAVLPTGAPPAIVVPEARQRLVQLDGDLAEAYDRFGPAALVAQHPILGGLTVGEWRRFHFVHTRHHCRQVAGRVAPFRMPA
jgi:hypothetical protein